MIDAPGHAQGQLCFYQADTAMMICGDQVLPDITPNISLVPGESADPLQLFLASLDELAEYRVELAFPGHRDPFSDFAGRIKEIIQHHQRRLQQIREWLQQPASAYSLCVMMFGERINGNIHNLRFGMSEMLAHLKHLEKLQHAAELRGGAGIQYRALPTGTDSR